MAEVKKLFTYPDGFDLVGSRSSARSQLGNSVPSLLAEKVVLALHGETAVSAGACRRTRG